LPALRGCFGTAEKLEGDLAAAVRGRRETWEEAGLRTYFVETWGCQMNALDSQRLAGVLEARGLRAAETPEAADVALLNTCSVREKAVHKVLTRLGELRHAKQVYGRPLVVGLCGCVAEQEGSALLARSAALDFVLGPGRIAQLGDAIDTVTEGRRVSITGFTGAQDYDAGRIARGDGARQYVTVVEGCNQHCTFCIVPYTRGHEVSRPLPEIVAEVTALVGNGAKEITLLGQTINAYRCPLSGAAFGELLSAVGSIPGIWRVQFVTSHPKFFDDRMIEAIAGNPRRGTYLHVPFQSGSDAVLKRMHRGYTREGYLDLVRKLRRAMPDVTLSTDVIVGFPGESESDFASTLQLVSEVRFGQLYGFIFSPRPRTPAARYEGRVSRALARHRLERVFALQSTIQIELNNALIGRDVAVLVDGPARRGTDSWQGRGPDNRVVNFPAWPGVRRGEVATLTVVGATPHALLGTRAGRDCEPPDRLA
jgi:tRNA-2-methylthio-N6-dimethylallyladenosine synthase